MTFFLSAEVQHEVGEPLRQAENKVRRFVVPNLAQGYGKDIEIWSLITILRPTIPVGWGEVYKYHPRDREAEFRLMIEYQAFKGATPEKQVQMLVQSILRSIDLFPVLKVKEFDVDRFRRDIVQAAVAGRLIAPEAIRGSGSADA